MVAGRDRPGWRDEPHIGVTAGLALAGLAVGLAACGSGGEAVPATPEAAVPTTATTPAEQGDGEAATEAATEVDQLYPDVIDASAERAADGSWTISATLSSPYDSPARYADAWRVVGPDGEVYGVRELTHDHASEQPFTRSQSGIVIPDTVSTVTVEGRDQVSGWGGATFQLDLP